MNGFEPLVLDGILQQPLYHGTSGVFEAAIREHGLKTEGEIGEWSYDVLDRLWPLVEIHLTDDGFWLQNEGWLKDLHNRQSRGAFNKRYGGVYLTASLPRALKYSERACGSELATNVLALVLGLEKRCPEELSSAISNHPLLELLDEPYDPAVFEVTGVEIGSLRSERGGSPEGLLNLWAEQSQSDEWESLKNIYLQGFTFECVVPIPSRNVQRQEIETVYGGVTTIRHQIRLERRDV